MLVLLTSKQLLKPLKVSYDKGKTYVAPSVETCNE